MTFSGGEINEASLGQEMDTATVSIGILVDEVAHAAGQDPYEFRRKLLAKEPRMQGVLELAAQKAGWSSGPMPAGKGRGIAVGEAFKTFVRKARLIQAVTFRRFVAPNQAEAG